MAASGVWAEASEESATEARKLGARALAALRQSAKDGDAEVRALALEAFGSLGNRAVVPLLKRALNDKDRSVQIVAAEKLARLGDAAGVPALERIASERPAKADGDTAAVAQVKALARGNNRAEAIRALARLGAASAEKVYKRGRKDPVGTVRDAAASALAKFGEKEELTEFFAALETPDEALKAAAARGFGEAGTPETLEPLLTLASDDSAQVRVAALEGLRAHGSAQEAALALLGALGDKSDLVRAKAYEGLGAVRHEGVPPALRKASAKEKNAYLQLLGLEALARQGSAVKLDLAQRSLSQDDVDARVVSVRLLDVVAGEEAKQLLATALDDADARVRVRAAGALVRRLAQASPEEARAAGGGRWLVPPEDRVAEEPGGSLR